MNSTHNGTPFQRMAFAGSLLTFLGIVLGCGCNPNSARVEAPKTVTSFDDVIGQLEHGASLLRNKRYPNMEVVDAFVTECKTPNIWRHSPSVIGSQLEKQIRADGVVTLATDPRQFMEIFNQANDNERMGFVAREAWGLRLLHMLGSEFFDRVTAEVKNVCDDVNLHAIPTGNGQSAYNIDYVVLLNSRIVDAWAKQFVLEVFEAIKRAECNNWLAGREITLDLPQLAAVVKAEFETFYNLYKRLKHTQNTPNLGITAWKMYLVLCEARAQRELAQGPEANFNLDIESIIKQYTAVEASVQRWQSSSRPNQERGGVPFKDKVAKAIISKSDWEESLRPHVENVKPEALGTKLNNLAAGWKTQADDLSSQKEYAPAPVMRLLMQVDLIQWYSADLLEKGRPSDAIIQQIVRDARSSSLGWRKRIVEIMGTREAFEDSWRHFRDATKALKLPEPGELTYE